MGLPGSVVALLIVGSPFVDASIGSRGLGSRRGGPSMRRSRAPEWAIGRAGMRNRPSDPVRSRTRSIEPSRLAGGPERPVRSMVRMAPARSRLRPCDIVTVPAAARHEPASSPRATRDVPPRPRSWPPATSLPTAARGAARASLSGIQSRTDPPTLPTRTPQRTVTSAPWPSGLKGSGPARSSRTSPGRTRPSSGCDCRPPDGGRTSIPSRTRRIRNVQIPHSTGVNWFRVSANARSKPSSRSTTACATAFSMPTASRVASLGAVRCAIIPGRFRPDARQKTSGRSTTTAPPHPASSHSRKAGSRPSRVHPASQRSSRTCGPDTLGNPSNGSRPIGVAAGAVAAPCGFSSHSSVDRVSWLKARSLPIPGVAGRAVIRRLRSAGSFYDNPGGS